MKKIASYTLIMFFGFNFCVTHKATCQPKADTQSYAYVANSEKLYASPRTSIQSATYTELSPGHTAACLFDQTSKTLRFIHSLPRFTISAVIHIQDITGRNLRSIKLDPKEVAGAEIPLGDLLPGSFQYKLILDTGRKIQGSFEILE